MITLGNALLVHLCLVAAGALVGAGALLVALQVGTRDRHLYWPFAAASLIGAIVFQSLASLYGAATMEQAVRALHWHVAGVLLSGPAIVWVLHHVTGQPLSPGAARVLVVGTLFMLALNALSPASLHFQTVSEGGPSRGPFHVPYVGHWGVRPILLRVWWLAPVIINLRLAVRVWRGGDRALGAGALGAALMVLASAIAATIVDYRGGQSPYAGSAPVAVLVVLLLGSTLGVAQRRQRLALVARTEELRLANERVRVESEQRLRLEQRLAEVQRLEALGRMAAGVAHDFNNVLTVVRGHAELLRVRLGDRTSERHDIEAIGAAAQRGASLTRQLLAFARRQELAGGPVDVDRLVAESRELLLKLAGDGNRLHLDLDAGDRAVHADATQLAQVLMNLVVNASDAMPRGGEVTVTTRFVPAVDAARCACGGAIEGEHVMLAVSDTGTGIEPATLPRIFEPFFTTKPPEKGTGLGLAMVHGVVSQSGGHVSVESQLGMGTTFRLCWPMWRAGHPARTAAEPVSGETASTPAGSGIA